MRDEEAIKEAFEAQAGSADESRELCDIFGLDPGGRHEERRDRLLSLLSGPPSRRRPGWLDLLLQVHAAGAQSFDDLEPEDLEAADLRVSEFSTMVSTVPPTFECGIRSIDTVEFYVFFTSQSVFRLTLVN